MNHILKFTLLAMTAVLSVVSAYLTATFLSDLGKSVGLGNWFAAAGVSLDVIKTILPAALIIAWGNGHKNGAIAGGLVAIALTGLSMMASFNSIDRSVSTAVNQRSAIELKQDQAKLIRDSIKTVIEQQNVYTNAGMATKAASLNPRIDELNKQLEQATGDVWQTSKPIIGQSGIAIISVAIEVACITGLMIASAMTRNQGGAVLHTTSTTMHSTSETTVETTHTSSNHIKLDQAKELILNGHARPSERGLAEAMRIPRPKARAILAALEVEGLIVTEGKIRTVVV